MTTLFLGALSGLQLTIFTVIYFLLLIYIIYSIFKREKGIDLVSWVLFVILAPIIGPILYLLKVSFSVKNISE
ncbi:hypothetical protein Lbys_0709 [Leadbetterella byssophila DSM 17132]|uniref:Cardiolipin synthase N-terminal domain-containing protein n=1 Tax=Leadbetterella byssophila (strain DSM 17132 / JCM 16389 / KACC 11308 / NBRC 106382 / 4M15) TaxID=649349 RepID=E4RZD2_LEAB4|nr:hypothetical protein Lbys_0709 [Leadbetterella byssophila DSM 17132]